MPPGEALAEVKVTPEAGYEPLKTTLLAGSGPVLVKMKVNVTGFPTLAGLGLAVGELAA